MLFEVSQKRLPMYHLHLMGHAFTNPFETIDMAIINLSCSVSGEIALIIIPLGKANLCLFVRFIVPLKNSYHIVYVTNEDKSVGKGLKVSLVPYLTNFKTKSQTVKGSHVKLTRPNNVRGPNPD